MEADQITAAETGRDTRERAVGASIAPTRTQAWITEFEKQLTPKLIDRLGRYARIRALPVALAGRKVDAYHVRELVQNVIADTWIGELHWDPAECSLEVHLLGAIRSRTYSQRKHVEDYPADTLGEASEESAYAEREASSLVANTDRAVHCVYAREVLALIRAEAVEDKPLLKLIDALEAGATKKEDVIALTKMKARTYHNAHTRLVRIVRKLTDQTLAPNGRA